MEMQLITKLSTIIFGGLLLPLTQANAVPNKVIFNHKPSCIEKDLGVISLKTEDLEMLDQEGNPQEKSLSLAVAQLSQKAIGNGADAVIITHVNHRVTNYSSRFKPASDEYVRKTLNTHIQAQAFKMCVDNKALSTIAAPYNAEGYKVHKLSYEYTFDVDELSSPSPYQLAQKIALPPANVSVSEAVYSLKLGSTIQDVVKTLGPASIEIKLERNQLVLGYGRNLWYLFTQNKLEIVSTKLDLLNSTGLNTIGFREGFDDTHWRIEGVSAQKSDINQVKLALASKQVNAKRNQLLVKDNQQNLLLEFETFHPEMASEPEHLLTHFTLSQINTSFKVDKPASLTASQQEWLFKRLSLSAPSLLTLDELTSQVPLAIKINIASDDNAWWLVGNHILLRFNHQQLEEIKLTEPLFANASESAFIKSINAMKLPLDKQGMLAYFSDAIDNFEQVDIETEKFTIQAKYESYDDNAELYELAVFYY
ncbi:hypothetical protein [Shewanella pealeana]|uniref:Uncharacterized protein n=1 Tax=Shewanella pealeana (strain ATCC 700345 / ANG-SQ1) TaxID=398579 RepID=A8H3G4_SHEPA|nr:hypothetical protein [Shewanella pealeana]ABV87101.1 conserved hypothetical protein [Shewanella pealeana ATCC 700345]